LRGDEIENNFQIEITYSNKKITTKRIKTKFKSKIN